MKIAITGSLASGKTSATKFLSKKNIQFLMQIMSVKQLYSQTSFIKKVKRNLELIKIETLNK